jgi:polar amino acid transport system substrate-binding protein
VRSLNILLWVLIIGMAPVSRAAAPLVVKVCVDAEPPPGAFWRRDAQGQKTTELVGASVEIVRAVFARMGKPVEIDGNFPWARCMAMAESGKVDFAMGAYFDAERAQRFAYTLPYATWTPQVFFRADRPLAINTVADLKRYRGCGMISATYEQYGLSAQELDLSTGYDSLFRKLKAQRCDYFVDELEPILGYKLIGKDYLAEFDIRHQPVPGAVAPSSHLIAAKNGAAADMIPAYNAALTAIIKSGEAGRIWKKYGLKRPGA